MNSTGEMNDSFAQAEQGLPAEREDKSALASGKDDGPDGRRRKLRWLFGICLVAVIAAGVAIPTLLLTGDSDSSAVTDRPTDEPYETDSTRNYLKASGLIFNATIPLFGTQMSKSYTNESQFRTDLIEACKFLVNHVVERNLQQNQPEVAFDDQGKDQPAAGPADTASETADGPSADGATDFETNNQEQGVDEGDLIKSDGTYVYAAYGDTIKVWNALTGQSTANVTLPEIPVPPSTPILPEPADGGRKTRVAEGPYYDRPLIQSLLLNSNRLVVIVSGYGSSQQQELGYSYDSKPPAIGEVLSTNIRIYQTSDLGDLTFLKETHVNGYFSEARSIDNNAHIVTFSWMNYNHFFYDPLSRSRPNLEGLSDEEYVEAAGLLATNELISEFVDAVVRDLSIYNGLLPDLAQIVLWQTTVSNSSEFERLVHDGSIIDGLAQVVSLDMTDSSKGLEVSMSGALMPSGWGFTYATSEMIAIMGQGWNFDPELLGSVDTTYLLCLELLGASATPAAIGMTSGHVIDQFAVDILSGHIRIATTVRNFRPFVDEPGGVPTETTVVPPSPETENQVVILSIPDLTSGNSNLTEVGRISDLGHPRETFTAVRFFDNIAYAVTYERKDPFYVLDLSVPTSPIVLGELNVTGFSSYLHSINDDNSIILAVGEEADENGTPMGIQISLFDSRVPTDPQLLRREVISNDDGRWPSSTVQWDHRAFRYLRLDTADSDSDAVTNQGILIIPLKIWTSTETENFDGFFAYDVSVDAISERFNISHPNRYVCSYSAWLPARSLVFDGDVTTTKGHSVVSTNLDSGERKWMLLFNDSDVVRPSCYVD